MPSVSNLRGKNMAASRNNRKRAYKLTEKCFLSNNGSFLTTNMEVKGKSSILN